MEFVINDKLIQQEQPEDSKTCQHKMMKKEIDGEICRYCKHCGMIAHEDGSFAYMCGFEYCRCMQ